MTMFGRVIGVVGLLAAGWFAVAPEAMAAGNAERGERLAYSCLGCHGIPNYKNTYPTYSVPKLGGQTAQYIVLSLQAYRNKERSHGTMHAQAYSMSDQDMADIAAYFAGTPVTSNPNAKPVGTAPEAAAVCVSCHGNDGVGIVPEYPTLAGQHADYLARALTDYKRGGRKNAVMAGFAGALSDADIRALARYYAAQPGLRTPEKRVTRFSRR
jgi:cytochrome c553